MLTRSERTPLKLSTMIYDYLSARVQNPHKNEEIRMNVAKMLLTNCDVNHILSRVTTESYSNCLSKRRKYALLKASKRSENDPQ